MDDLYDKEIKTKKRTKFLSIKKKASSTLVLSLVVIIVFVVGVFAGISKPWEKIGPVIIKADGIIEEGNYILTISTVEKIIKPASDLITSKYIYKDADSYENYKNLFGKRLPFTTDKVVFTYKGTVSVGIDLSEVIYEIDDESQIIRIKLPEIRITSNEIDHSSFEYPFESDSIFNSTGMSDYTELLATLKREKEVEVINDKEFMETARHNTENVLEQFLTASDLTKNYTIIFE